MIYYFVTQKNMGGEVILYPQFPKTADNCENRDIKRICVSQSILGCIYSIRNNYGGCNTYVYFCDVDPVSVYQPSKEDVYDVDETGEIWILSKQLFILYKIIKFDNKNQIFYPNLII